MNKKELFSSYNKEIGDIYDKLTGLQANGSKNSLKDEINKIIDEQINEPTNIKPGVWVSYWQLVCWFHKKVMKFDKKKSLIAVLDTLSDISNLTPDNIRLLEIVSFEKIKSIRDSEQPFYIIYKNNEILKKNICLIKKITPYLDMPQGLVFFRGLSELKYSKYNNVINGIYRQAPPMNFDNSITKNISVINYSQAKTTFQINEIKYSQMKCLINSTLDETILYFLISQRITESLTSPVSFFPEKTFMHAVSKFSSFVRYNDDGRLKSLSVDGKQQNIIFNIELDSIIFNFWLYDENGMAAIDTCIEKSKWTQDIKKRYSKALLAYQNKDWGASIFYSITTLERTLRILVEETSDIKNISEVHRVEHLLLNDLLTKYGELYNENVSSYIKNVLSSSTGANMRNDIFHGIDFSQETQNYASLIIAILFLIIYESEHSAECNCKI